MDLLAEHCQANKPRLLPRLPHLPSTLPNSSSRMGFFSTDADSSMWRSSQARWKEWLWMAQLSALGGVGTRCVNMSSGGGWVGVGRKSGGSRCLISHGRCLCLSATAPRAPIYTPARLTRPHVHGGIVDGGRGVVGGEVLQRGVAG